MKHLVYMPIRHVVLKIYVPCKNFHVPSQYLYKPCKAYVYWWENKYSTCPAWKITCPVGHITTKVYVPWDKIYMPRACGHALMSSPVIDSGWITYIFDRCYCSLAVTLNGIFNKYWVLILNFKNLKNNGAEEMVLVTLSQLSYCRKVGVGNGSPQVPNYFEEKTIFISPFQIFLYAEMVLAFENKVQGRHMIHCSHYTVNGMFVQAQVQNDTVPISKIHIFLKGAHLPYDIICDQSFQYVICS